LTQRLPAAVVLVRPHRSEEAARLVGREQICTTLEAFLARKPPIVIECASRRCLVEMGAAVLAAGIDLAPLSLTAFADPDFERCLMAAAEAGPGRLLIAPGAIGTLDLLATAREEGLRRVIYRQIKSPAMWRLTPASALVDLGAVVARQIIVRGSVRELAQTSPTISTPRSASRWLVSGSIGPRPSWWLIPVFRKRRTSLRFMPRPVMRC